MAVSGDLTQGARISEFRAARGFLDRLLAPHLAVPGNHDISPYNLLERFTDPYARWRRMISPETSPIWRNENVAVLGLNSARRMGLHWDWSRGRVTHLRLARLLAQLDALPTELTKIVVVHHPLLPPGEAPSTPVVSGAAAALRELEAHKVRLVLAGHLHRGFARLASPNGGQPLILQGAQQLRFVCEASQTAITKSPSFRMVISTYWSASGTGMRGERGLQRTVRVESSLPSSQIRIARRDCITLRTLFPRPLSRNDRTCDFAPT